LQRIQVDNFDSSFSQALVKNRNLNFSKTFYIPASKPLTQPYWLENKMEEGYFNVKNPLQIGQPDVDAAYNVLLELKIFGEPFIFSKAARFKFTDPVKGEVYEPLVVVPPIVLNADKELLIVNSDTARGSVEVTARAFKKIDIPKETLVSAVKYDDFFNFGASSFEKGQVKTRLLDITNKKDADFVIRIGNVKDSLNMNMHQVKYDHIPYINYYTVAKYRVRKIDIKTVNKKIGYIIGAGDKVPDALEQMGYDVTLLTDKELSRNNLQQFDAIISGVRAYNTNEWMPKYYDKLMKYVNDGGNYIVQYNTSNFVSSIKTKIGPYNFEVSRSRVTDETAPVIFLKPEHPVLNFPNKITQKDFEGWIQERSIYHAGNWDKNFETILSMGDPGEKADEGSLVISKYGKGYFTYTGLVFFRELPAGVPGAYRLLANIIALNRKKAF
jgi:hypothetical protein